MSDPIKVFICYKKMLSNKRDRRTLEKENTKAFTLNTILKQEESKYQPWIDQSIDTGVKWEKEIYSHLIISDVLLVVVMPGTAASPWVHKEIAIAKALDITIFPLGVDIDEKQRKTEQEKLFINDIQGILTHNVADQSRGALLVEIGERLEQARKETRSTQKTTLNDLFARRNPRAAKAPDNQKAATFIIEKNNRKCNLHVASGDISRVRGIDVLVNSENDYMQMARFFESSTVSSILRSRGANIIASRYEDTIQKELDWQLKDEGRPVQPGQVFATSAGGPGSDLFKTNKARYILHVAAVQAVPADKTVIPFKQPYQIERCVRNSLDKILEINQIKGVKSQPGTEQPEEQKRLAAEPGGIVKSVIFPLFGTGQGGSAPSDVLDPMLSALTNFLEDNDELAANLTDIYISAYTEQDVNTVTEFLKARFKSA